MTKANVPGSAMVLAAGLGKRMRPLTISRPKPLVEVAGETLLDRALGTLRRGGVEQVVVNMHYLADSLEAHLKARPIGMELALSDERAELLETGGGITKALPQLQSDPFLAINADNIWIDGPISTAQMLADRWNPDEMDALLLMVPLARANNHGGQGDFHMDQVGRLRRRQAGRVAPYVFTGLQMLSKKLFDGQQVEPFSMNRLYDKAAKAGRLYGVVHQGIWFDVGTVAAVRQTEELLEQL